MGEACEAVERALDRLGTDPWNAFLHVDVEAARRRARALDAAQAELPMRGLVLSVKDNLAVRAQPMTCGSRHLERYVAPYTATVVARLEDAGAVVLGKTNLDEFGAGSSGENSAFGPTLNPHDASRVPGGSSSGAGASVAAGVVACALGSDTGGSIRAPASFCGAAALKPSYGLLSRHGLADLAMSLESPAPMAADVALLSRMMETMAGPDARDAVTGRPFAGVVDVAPEGLRVGVPEAFFVGVEDDVARPVRAALARLERRGAVLQPVELPSLPHALAAYYVLNYAEFASAMARYDGVLYGTSGAEPSEARANLGAEVKRRIFLGTFATSRESRQSWYEAAVRAREQIAREFADALAQVDVLMGPTMPTRAFALGDRAADPIRMYASDVLTVSANLARVPAGSVPLRVEGLPVGLQVVGRPGDDGRVLRAMALVEELAGVPL